MLLLEVLHPREATTETVMFQYAGLATTCTFVGRIFIKDIIETFGFVRNLFREWKK